MALVLKDRVRETSTTTGTGTFTLAGAVAGFQSFSAIGTGNNTYYTIVSTSDWEVGIGTWTSPDQLSRDTVLASTNGGALVTFGSGTKDVFLTFPAEGFAVPPAIGGTTPSDVTATNLTVNTEQVFNTVTVGNIGTAHQVMVDADGTYDVLDTYMDDGAGGKYPVRFSGGINTYPLYLLSPDYATNYKYIVLQPLSGMSASYTLTLPATAGSNNQVLKTDGTGILNWTTVDPLTLTGISDPTAPSNTNTTIYSKSFGGYATLAGRNALNTSFGLQSALWSKATYSWSSSTSASGYWTNMTGTGTGTLAVVSPTAGATKYQATRRSTYNNLATTTNQILGIQPAQFNFFRGSVAGQGGFFFYAKCGFDIWTNGSRFFCGMATATTVISADPSALNNTVGFCVDAADNGAISFLTRGTAATKASTGLTITSNKGYECYIYCSPNSSQYTWQIIDINTGTSASGTATANLPTNTTMQTCYVLGSNAALTALSSTRIGVINIYVETDN